MIDVRIDSLINSFLIPLISYLLSTQLRLNVSVFFLEIIVTLILKEIIIINSSKFIIEISINFDFLSLPIIISILSKVNGRDFIIIILEVHSGVSMGQYTADIMIMSMLIYRFDEAGDFLEFVNTLIVFFFGARIIRRVFIDIGTDFKGDANQFKLGIVVQILEIKVATELFSFNFEILFFHFHCVQNKLTFTKVIFHFIVPLDV